MPKPYMSTKWSVLSIKYYQVLRISIRQLVLKQVLSIKYYKY